ncbi:MAG: GDP-L-fucose synthase [Phycisphaerae bacterium]|nr:GDP-L-fucose synthase [Phycisphaerae bacterium]
MDKTSRIYVAGHSGLLGSGLCRVLRRQGYRNLLVCTHAELELTDRRAVEVFFAAQRPEYVFLAAAMVGGIHCNAAYPAEMIHANLAIQDNVIDVAHRAAVKGLFFPGSACAYPKHAEEPLRPEAILTGPVEPTNEPFAVAKIAGIRMCQAYNRQYGTRFLAAIPAALYGPGDHFDANGHVVAALMARFHQAKCSGAASVDVWGTGRPRREFLYVDDAAEAMVLLMNRDPGGELVNIGSGEDIALADLAGEIARVVGFTGRIVFDASRPDGIPRRLLDSTRIRQMGWRPRTALAEGLAATYEWFLGHKVAEPT